MNIIQSIQSVFASYEERRQVAFKDISKEYAEVNNIIPNMDKNGRLHAPCDGYHDPKHHDIVYSKGEYLPFPNNGQEDLNLFNNKKITATSGSSLRVKGNVSLYNEIEKGLSSLDSVFFTKGKSWGANGVDVCYIYINHHSSTVKKELHAVLEEYVNVHVKEEVKPLISLEGKHTVKGTVKKVNEEFKQISYNMVTSIFKVYIELDDGSTCYGTLAKSIIDVEIGSKVQFTATFKRGTNTHSFFSRPSKASVIGAE